MARSTTISSAATSLWARRGCCGRSGWRGLRFEFCAAGSGSIPRYVSRLLRSLEGRGLIAVEASANDGRVRQARLTAAGLAERTELDRRSDAFARSVLEPLTERQRVELAAAMGEVERLLAASIIRIDVADPAGPDARWCFERYFAELAERFDAGFDPARSIPAQAHELIPPAGVLLVASLRQEPVGCGAAKFHRGAPSEVQAHVGRAASARPWAGTPTPPGT